MTALRPLSPVLKHQAWGSTDAIPVLRGDQPDGRPVAELWVSGLAGSASPAGSRRTADPAGPPLDVVLEQVGAERLRVLVKVLAVAAPLSLQLHPDDDAAARGFAAGRTHFTDPFGKPELVYALEEFTTLCGLRPPDDALELLDRLRLRRSVALGSVVDALAAGDPAKAVAAALEVGADVAEPVAAALAASTDAALGPAREVSAAHAGDPAVAASLLLSPYWLEPGSALWCPAGCPHVHVSGLAVEVQASADTTLRAGLTTRPVDRGLFLSHLGRRGPEPVASRPTGAEDVVASPDGDLRLGVVRVGPRGPAAQLPALPDASLLLCLEGPAAVTTADAEVRLAAGDGAYVQPGAGPLRVDGGVVVRASRVVA